MSSSLLLIFFRRSFLTNRECDVALLAVKGLNNREIAVDLQITEKWVKSCKTVIYKKLGVKKGGQFLALIMRIDPGCAGLTISQGRPNKVKPAEEMKTPEGEIILPRGNVMLQ